MALEPLWASAASGLAHFLVKPKRTSQNGICWQFSGCLAFEPGSNGSVRQNLIKQGETANTASTYASPGRCDAPRYHTGASHCQSGFRGMRES